MGTKLRADLWCETLKSSVVHQHLVAEVFVQGDVFVFAVLEQAQDSAHVFQIALI